MKCDASEQWRSLKLAGSVIFKKLISDGPTLEELLMKHMCKLIILLLITGFSQKISASVSRDVEAQVSTNASVKNLQSEVEQGWQRIEDTKQGLEYVPKSLQFFVHENPYISPDDQRKLILKIELSKLRKEKALIAAYESILSEYTLEMRSLKVESETLVNNGCPHVQDLEQARELLNGAKKIDVRAYLIHDENSGFENRAKLIEVSLEKEKDVKKVANAFRNSNFIFNAEVTENFADGAALGSLECISLMVDGRNSMTVLSRNLIICQDRRAYVDSSLVFYNVMVELLEMSKVPVLNDI